MRQKITSLYMGGMLILCSVALSITVPMAIFGGKDAQVPVGFVIAFAILASPGLLIFVPWMVLDIIRDTWKK